MENPANGRRDSVSKTRRLVGMALFAAIVVVLQLLGSFIKIGTFSISLVLVPIVVGAAVYGPKAGAFLGGVFGVVVTIACITGADGGGYILWSASPVLTVLVCMAKGILAGLVSGIVYSAVSKLNRYVGVILAAIVCPIVNTGIFCLAMFVFFYGILVQWAGGSDVIYYALFVLTGVNFLIELGVNVVLSPIIFSIIKIGKKS